MNIIIKNMIFLTLVLSLSSWSVALEKDDAPVLTIAKKQPEDPWYSYAKRPLLSSLQAVINYGSARLAEIVSRTSAPVNHVPWTLRPPKSETSSELFKLKDIVVDRIKDPITGKSYVKLYHATTSDLIDVFKPGAKAIRFDVAELTALGMGFYLAANVNEAKYYGCERLGARKWGKADLKTLLLIIGVSDDDVIQGKWAKPDTKQSDDKTGEPYDKSVFFVRNEERHNQFVFFKNSAPYLKIFEIITLPDGFGKARDRQDGDGLPVTSTEPETNYGYKCPY